MRIGILTQYYPPEHGAPQNRLHDLASRLAKKGAEIVVLTAMPNYPKGEVFESHKGKFICAETIDGVKVIRSYIFASKNKKTFIQLAVYFSFVFSSMLAGLFKFGKLDYLICESPPLFLGFSAIFLKLITKAKLIMNISDLWPESAVQLGLIGPGPGAVRAEKIRGGAVQRVCFRVLPDRRHSQRCERGRSESRDILLPQRRGHRKIRAYREISERKRGFGAAR